MADRDRAAAPAALLRDFVNTLDVETGTDTLDAPAALTRWLREHGLVGTGGRADDRDLDTALALREGLRAAMASHHDRGAYPRNAELDAALAGLRLRVRLGAEGPTLESVDVGVRTGLGGIAAAIVDSVADGTWERLKVCSEESCRWAFIDFSKNRSRSWCAMSVCGNRRKTRSYRARRRSSPEGAPA